ncbi:MAG: hypothetical protein U1F26_01250 [Lysobacterales bacterium]
MTHLPETIPELITVLLEMVNLETSTLEQAQLAQSQCLALVRHLQGSPLCAEVDEYVWHYLSDADIRFKDSEYAHKQRTELRALLTDWRRELAQ